MSPSPLVCGATVSQLLLVHGVPLPPYAEPVSPSLRVHGVPCHTRSAYVSMSLRVESVSHLHKRTACVPVSAIPRCLRVISKTRTACARGSLEVHYGTLRPPPNPTPSHKQRGYLTCLPRTSLPHWDRKSQETRRRRRKVPQRRRSQGRAAVASAPPPGAARPPASQRPRAGLAQDGVFCDPPRL